jgi:hypothetical protein
MTENEILYEIKLHKNKIKAYKLEIDENKFGAFNRKIINSLITKIEKENLVINKLNKLIIDQQIELGGIISINTSSSTLSYINNTIIINNNNNDTVKINILEDYTKTSIIVIDDIFQSVSKKYYVISNNNIIYINNILDIEKETENKNESILYKWFTKKEKDYFRSKKLKNII